MAPALRQWTSTWMQTGTGTRTLHACLIMPSASTRRAPVRVSSAKTRGMDRLHSSMSVFAGLTPGATWHLQSDLAPEYGFWGHVRGQLALRKLYHESERLLVVLYTSPTCGPCRTLKPIFSKVAEEFSGKVRPCSLLRFADTHHLIRGILLHACTSSALTIIASPQKLCPCVKRSGPRWGPVLSRSEQALLMGLSPGAAQLHLVEIDIEEDPEIAQAGGINGTPTVQIFKNKERLHHLPGVKMKREYRQLIESNL